MIRWTSPQGERLTLRPCIATDGRYVVEVRDGRRLLSVADLETGEDIDKNTKREPMDAFPWIVKAIRRWGGKMEEKAA